jgi:hypothetical protein
MDYVGDADPLDDDEPFAPREPWLTPEARVLTGAGLLALGLLGGQLFQVLTFFVQNNDGSTPRWQQWASFGGPGAVLGLVAAVLVAPVRSQVASRAVRGGAVAVLVVGVVLAVLVAGGFLLIAGTDDTQF